MEKKDQHIKGGKAFLDSSDKNLRFLPTDENVKPYKVAPVPNPEREKEIQELALKIFQRNLGFSIKADADEAVIQQLVDSEPFQNYIALATKDYDKRIKALNNKKYPVILVPADGKRGVAGGAWCMAFVYTKYKGNFVVKGYLREVEAYIKKNFTHYFYNLSLWNLGGHRDIWYFWKNSVNIYDPDKYKKGMKKENQMFRVRPRCDWSWDVSEKEYKRQHKEADKTQLLFKRMPKRWIPEFDNF